MYKDGEGWVDRDTRESGRKRAAASLLTYLCVFASHTHFFFSLFNLI